MYIICHLNGEAGKVPKISNVPKFYYTERMKKILKWAIEENNL